MLSKILRLECPINSYVTSWGYICHEVKSSTFWCTDPMKHAIWLRLQSIEANILNVVIETSAHGKVLVHGEQREGFTTNALGFLQRFGPCLACPMSRISYFTMVVAFYSQRIFHLALQCFDLNSAAYQ